MSENTRNFTVGIASIIALLGLSWLLMSFGELDFLFQRRYLLTINTNDASGLRDGSAIEFHGVPIGVIQSVQAQPNPEFPVRIIARIDRESRLPIDVKPHVSMQLIGGAAILQFRRPSPPTPPTAFWPDDNSAEITTKMGGGLLAELTEQMEGRMGPLMDSLERFNKLSDTFIALGENLTELVMPQTPDAVAGGEAPNLRTAIGKLNTVLDQANDGLKLATEFLGDEQLRTDARDAVQRASRLIDQATSAVDRYAQLAQSLQTDASEFIQRIAPVMDTLALTLEEVRRISRLAMEGRGTVGQLLNNPDLYNSLTDAATRLDRTLIELQVLIQQMRAEGVNVKF